MAVCFAPRSRRLLGRDFLNGLRLCKRPSLRGLFVVDCVGDVLVLPGIMANDIDDLVAANRILAKQGILDSFGHVSVRDAANPERYLMSRSLAPELVTADDIFTFDAAFSKPVVDTDLSLYSERFIHGAIYKARPDVNAVVHTHSPSIIPFGIVASVPLRPVYHMTGFLHAGVPIYEIRNDAGMSDMLIRNVELGEALARVLGNKTVALMRGHGNVVVATTIPLVVYRAIYTEINARLQMQALSLGGSINYLEPEEGKKLDEAMIKFGIHRPWEYWKQSVLEK